MRPRHWQILLAVLALVLLAGAGGAAAHRHHPRRHHRHHKHHKRRVHRQQVQTLPWMGPQPMPSIFGLDTDLYDSNHAYWARDIPTAKQMGARFDHFVLGVKTASGNFGEPDYVITQARKAGMGVVLSFGGIPQACSKSQPSDAHRCPPTSAADMSQYQAYVRRVLLRYRNVVTYYESWVEINHNTSFMTASQYANVLKAQYAAFQSVNSQYHLQLKLLLGSTMGFSIEPGSGGWVAALPLINQVLNDLHGARPFDGIALHGYRFPPATEGPDARAWDYVGGVPTAPGSAGPFPAQGCDHSPWCQMTWTQELSAYEQEFENHGYGQQPLWLTEFGWPGNAQPGDDYFPGDAVQTMYLTEAYADLLRLPFVQTALWFNMRDYQPGYDSPDPSFFYHYGLLEYGFVPKPAAAVFRTLALANPGR
jgi:hypothetical protein